MQSSPHIVIVGGGFGGVFTAKHLLSYGYRVTLISERNYFTFTPMLHEVATGGLSARDIIFEFQSFFRDEHFTFVRGHVGRVDIAAKTAWVGEQEVRGDYLVLATGAVTNTYAMKGVEHAYMLKTIDDAKHIKQRVIELVQGTSKNISIAIIGAGPTGIELAFELEDFLKVLKSHNPAMRCTLRLVNNSSDLLKAFPVSIQRYTRKRIESSHIEFLENKNVTEITSEQVIYTDGALSCDMAIVAAGVKPNTDCVDESQRAVRDHIAVRPTLQLLDADQVFALGDIIMMDDTPMPKLAQAATQQAVVVARNIKSFHENKSTPARYTPQLKGLLISLGARQGAGSLHGIVVKGFFAWWLWRTVYLFKIPGIQNKFRVAFSWTINLFTKRSLVEE